MKTEIDLIRIGMLLEKNGSNKGLFIVPNIFIDKNVNEIPHIGRKLNWAGIKDTSYSTVRYGLIDDYNGLPTIMYKHNAGEPYLYILEGEPSSGTPAILYHQGKLNITKVTEKISRSEAKSKLFKSSGELLLTRDNKLYFMSGDYAFLLPDRVRQISKF